MKKTLRILSLFALSALYCFVISLQSNSVYLSQAVRSSSSEQVLLQSLEPAALLCHTEQREGRVTSGHAGQVGGVSCRVNDGAVSGSSAAQVLLRPFVAYTIYARYHILRLVEIGIIFPFHYFW